MLIVAAYPANRFVILSVRYCKCNLCKVVLSYLKSNGFHDMVLYLSLMAAGFVTCVFFGSLAWYASKRPAGWESAEAPGWAKSLGVEKIRAGVES